MKMKNILRYQLSVVVCLFIFCLLGQPCFSQEAKIENTDGLTIIRNPKNPVKKDGSFVVLVLKKDLTIGESLDDEEYMFSQIGGVMVDVEEDIIVIDEKEIVVKVFDKTGKHLRTFGKRGQGPGEFASVARIVLKGGRDIVLLDRANGRFSYFSKEGECLKEILLGKHAISRVKPDSRGYIYSDTMIRDGNNVSDIIMRFDPEFNEFETIAKEERIIDYRKLNPISVWFMYAVMEDDCFIWGRNTVYEFTILDQAGKPYRKVIKDYEPVKITKEDQEKIIEERFGEIGIPDFVKISFPNHYTPWYYFICDDVGGIYVRTFEKDEQGHIMWDYFDKNGIYRLSFSLPLEEVFYCIKNNKAYSFINENEEGIPVVIRYQMEWQ